MKIMNHKEICLPVEIEKNVCFIYKTTHNVEFALHEFGVSKIYRSQVCATNLKLAYASKHIYGNTSIM